MKKELHVLSEAARQVGVRPNRLVYAIVSGDLPEPSLRLASKRIFTAADIEAAKAYFEKKQRRGKSER